MKLRAQNIRIAFLLLISIMVFGIIGFMSIEGFTLIEAFYMTIITVSTVGFKEGHDLDPAGQIFTAFLIMMSFGLFAYALSSLTRFLFDGNFRNYYLDYKMRKRVDKMHKHVIVFGWGRTGGRAVEELKRHNSPFVIVEKEEGRINDIRANKIGPYIRELGTADEALNQAGLRKARALITTLPNDAANLMIIITARKINPKVRIISRAVRDNSDLKLRRAGADNVIMSDRMGGSRMAKGVTQPITLKFIDLLLDQKANVHLEQLYCTELSQCYLNKSIRAMNLGATTGANIIGMRKEDGSIIFNPSADVILNCSDRLFVMGNNAQIKRLKEALFERAD